MQERRTGERGKKGERGGERHETRGQEKEWRCVGREKVRRKRWDEIKWGEKRRGEEEEKGREEKRWVELSWESWDEIRWDEMLRLIDVAACE
jgi:hypothetical protein